MPNRKNNLAKVALNKSDRRVLDKYTKYYSNFIESNTAKTDILEEDRYKGKD